MDLEKAIEFLLQQQAASQARFDAQMEQIGAKLDASSERAEREIAQIRAELRRAVRLSIQEARTERKRRKEEDAKLAAADAKLAAGQEALQRSLQAFIDSLKQSRNGHDTN
jgi:uncharacterized protein YqfA (UPF0365 family)